MGTSGLHFVNVSVPRYAELHATVIMSCHFELGYARLYSVKWYKDDYEFFSYSPVFNCKWFALPGIKLDMSRSDMNQVTLVDLQFSSSGTYRCEVSTEGPNFETTFSNENVTVRALPASEPIINGLQPAYSPEDMIEANCTCPKSKPKATMAWYLNGIKVERYFLVFYATSEDEEGLSESVLGLNRRAEVTLFPGGGPLELRCTATVQERTWAKTATALLARLNNQKLAQDDFTNKSDEVCVSLLLLLSSMLLNFCW
ncbi:uncharacterized protein LOC132199764 isoform X2 [Neocloeon triangulifer]|uniref:uncharacterized protein LOC132199764 isoform X2 n=1 Tax=Neocloeon triangulifer TaxID=2078957 RepID=UPI00286F557E|nr:uncharacterized protein LOC132199764 isoform X2 [Neocloeon triangulifer]